MARVLTVKKVYNLSINKSNYKPSSEVRFRTNRYGSRSFETTAQPRNRECFDSPPIGQECNPTLRGI